MPVRNVLSASVKSGSWKMQSIFVPASFSTPPSVRASPAGYAGESRTQLLDHGEKGDELAMGAAFGLARAVVRVKGAEAEADGAGDGGQGRAVGGDELAEGGAAG